MHLGAWLTCCSDPYPFQYLSNHSGNKIDNVVFVDIDFPELIKKKATMIKKTKEILSIIGEPQPIEKTTQKSKNNEGVLLSTPHYLAIGCDLTLLDELKQLLSSLFAEKDTLFAFTAEVSITYMPREAADNLIAWASQFTQSRFVLLEQIVPSGPDHPFAKTMLKHFNKLNTPLNSVLTYQTVADQKDRFQSRGWSHVQASDLYQFWEQSITNDEKIFLDSVETFDEWEEFILFCQHYVILYASTSETPSSLLNTQVTAFPQVEKSPESYVLSTVHSAPSNKTFAAGCVYDDNTVIQIGGLTTKRTNNSVLLSRDEAHEFKLEKEPFKERMCHAVCRVAENDFILTGGRLAPSAPLADAWRLQNNVWSKIQDMPEPRCRHVSFATEKGELHVFGGSFSAVSPWIKLDSEKGWIHLKQSGASLPNLMSPSLAFDKTTSQGWIFGGMASDYSINSKVYHFEIKNDMVQCSDITMNLADNAVVSLARYGAQAMHIENNQVLLAGGVSQVSLIPNSESFVIFNTKTFTTKSVDVTSQIKPEVSLPLLSGFSLDRVGTDIVTYGGGAICFSFGAYRNNITVLSRSDKSPVVHTISKAQVVLEKPQTVKPTKTFRPTTKKIKVKKVPRISVDTLKSHDDFLKEIYAKGQPVVFEKNTLGTCTTRWKDSEYLINAVGGDRKIVAHVSEALNLNFLAKNFKYDTMDFETFVNNVFHPSEHSKNLYLRSLSSDKPMGKPAIFRHDFAALAADFVLPSALQPIENTHFSSPFRISSPNTAIWLHYDVTANILCQAVGRKRVRLYPPSDVVHLSFPAGASTSLIDNIFDFPQSELPGRVHPFETVLEPGDVVFIPAAWLHATLPLDASISINFFWKDLDQQVYGHGKDIYGNKDIEAYENGRKAVQKIGQAFEGIPEEMRKFYLLRLADELRATVQE